MFTKLMTEETCRSTAVLGEDTGTIEFNRPARRGDWSGQMP